MRVFLGWSGDLSRQLADAFHDWIKCVIQDTDPFLSSRDIDVGTKWQALLTDTLKDCSFGVFFLTPENLDNKWMHFEAGALLKQIGESKVCPFLCDTGETALEGPFGIFQATRFERDDVLRLVRSINKSLPKPLAEGTLRECFSTHWPSLERRLLDIKSKEQQAKHAAHADPRTLQAAEFRDIAAQIFAHDNLHMAGLRDVFETRLQCLSRIRREIDVESKEVVIIGSSLKGMIGIGGDSAGEQNLVRIALIDALKRSVRISILMTNPVVAHHRSRQEGREKGEIETEIVENLVYLLKERVQSREVDQNLEVKLYNGTPTIFLVCTSHVMFFNPYTFYSKAYESFCFRADSGTKLFDHYYNNHYLAAWNDARMTVQVRADARQAARQVRDLITGQNQHKEMVIAHKDDQKALLRKVEALVPDSANSKGAVSNGRIAPSANPPRVGKR
jgi:hypothetical protein